MEIEKYFFKITKRMRYIIITIISACCLMFLMGCSSVVSKYPIGIDNYSVSSDDWNGTWLSEDEVIKISVIDESNGIIKLVWIDQDGKNFKLETITCQIKKGKKYLYLNVLEMPSEELGGYYIWGRIKKESYKIIFWLPSVKAFQEAAEAKSINAIVEKTKSGKSGKQRINTIKLLDNPKVIIDLVENNNGKYFDWESPIVLVKIRK